MPEKDILTRFVSSRGRMLKEIEGMCVDSSVKEFNVPAEEFSRGGNYRIVTQSLPKRGRFCVTVFDENVAASRRSSQIAPLDMEGYIFLTRNDLPLSKAVRFHRQVVAYLNELGY